MLSGAVRMNTLRDSIYRFSSRVSARWFFLALYYLLFFFLFFLLADTTLFALPEDRLLARLLSAAAMGALFTVIHLWIFRNRR